MFFAVGLRIAGTSSNNPRHITYFIRTRPSVRATSHSVTVITLARQTHPGLRFAEGSALLRQAGFSKVARMTREPTGATEKVRRGNPLARKPAGLSRA